MTISLVLPCFNEEENIERTVRDANAWFEKAGIDGEIIVVNDGSIDRSAIILDGLETDIPTLHVVTHIANRGYGAALRSGADAATKEVTVFMDSDGQFHAADAERLLPSLATVDFVAGYREKRADKFIRILNARLYNLLVRWTLSVRVQDVNCALKAFRTSIWPRIRPLHSSGALFNAELFLRLAEQKIPMCEVPVPHYPRLYGQPTGAKPTVILRMFRELRELNRSRKYAARSSQLAVEEQGETVVS